MVLATGRAPTRQFNGGSRFSPPRALEVAVVNLVLHCRDGFEQRGTQGVVGGLRDDVRAWSHEVEGRAKRRAFRQAAFEVNPRFVDLKVGLQGFELLVDHLDDGGGRSMVAVCQCQFHWFGRAVVLNDATLPPEKQFA